MQTIMLATGIECSYPKVENGKRRDQLEETRHYQNWREDFELCREIGARVVHYGPPYYLMHTAPHKYDWSFTDEVLPVDAPPPKPPLQPTPRRLVNRLQRRRDEVLRFISDLRVPFDNDGSERDLRMIKLQQKISGCFRTLMAHAASVVSEAISRPRVSRVIACSTP